MGDRTKAPCNAGGRPPHHQDDGAEVAALQVVAGNIKCHQCEARSDIVIAFIQYMKIHDASVFVGKRGRMHVPSIGRTEEPIVKRRLKSVTAQYLAERGHY